MAIPAIMHAINTALAWLSSHPTVHTMVNVALFAGIQAGARAYDKLPPAEKAKVKEVVTLGVKMAAKLALADAADWTRNELHMQLPNLPGPVVDFAVKVVEAGGEELIENVTKDKGKK